jgi:hypothetical protein
MMDNASNNDTLIKSIETRCLAVGISFSARYARMRSMPHTIHLAALKVWFVLYVCKIYNSLVIWNSFLKALVPLRSPSPVNLRTRSKIIKMILLPHWTEYSTLRLPPTWKMKNMSVLQMESCRLYLRWAFIFANSMFYYWLMHSASDNHSFC